MNSLRRSPAGAATTHTGRAPRELLTGLLYLMLACGFGTYALQYEIGNVARMGVGFFPLALAILLGVVGSAILARAFLTAGGRGQSAGLEPVPGAGAPGFRFGLRVPVLVIGSVALFGVLLEPVGLVAALIVLVAGARLAEGGFNLRGVLGNAVAIVALVLVVFVWLLGMPLPLWPNIF